MRVNLHEYFCCGTMGDWLNGFFPDHVIAGMLEAKDYEAVYLVSPYIGHVVDMCVGLCEEATLTSFFTLYVDFVEFIFCLRLTPG